MTITITEPRPFNRITNVRSALAGGTTGSICACGNASSQRGTLTGVWAKVYNLGAVVSNQHDPSAQVGTFDSGSGNWWFLGTQLVPNVPCVANPKDNTALFVVWCAYGGSPALEENQTTQIAARCSTATNCDGTAHPCLALTAKHFLLAGAGAGVGGRATLETAPRQYKVQGGQARGPLAELLSTPWVLSLRTGGCGCGCAAWVNEGDGIRSPHVELRPDGVVAAEWQLTLALNGHRIRYACPARDWSPLGANRLVLTEASDGLPKTLTVVPV